MTLDEARGLLLALFPPGADRWIDFAPNSDPWLVLDGAAQALCDKVLTPLDDIQSDANPMTLTLAGIGAWETALDLSTSTIATSGTQAQRLAQILARLREFGTPTIDNITAALVAVTGNAAAVEILEHSRNTLTARHSYWIGGTEPPASVTIAANTTTSFVIPVGENAPCGKMGAQLHLKWTHATPGDLTVTLAGPDSHAKTWAAGSLGTAALSSTAYYLFAPDFAGHTADGNWTISIVNAGGNVGSVTYTLTPAGGGLFCEGVGRSTNGSGAEGLGARIFEACALIDETLVGAAYDRSVARAIVQRWAPAHVMMFLAVKATNGSSFGVFDDANSTFDGCIFGT